MLTGINHIMYIDVTQDQVDRWEKGELIQNAMPNISADEREYIMTGVTPKEWLDAFGRGDEEE